MSFNPLKYLLVAFIHPLISAGDACFHFWWIPFLSSVLETQTYTNSSLNSRIWRTNSSNLDHQGFYNKWDTGTCDLMLASFQVFGDLSSQRIHLSCGYGEMKVSSKLQYAHTFLFLELLILQIVILGIYAHWRKNMTARNVFFLSTVHVNVLISLLYWCYWWW